MQPAEIKLNEQIYDSASPELIFLPGKPHTLHITPNWEVLNHKSVIAMIKKVLPNGRIERLQSQLCSNLPVDEFELGPLTAPAIYEYEGGLVYRRGYQLEIQLINQTDNKILFRLSLFQGLLKEPTGWRQGSPDRKFRNEIPAGPEYFVEGDSERLEYNPMYGVEPPIALRISDEVLTDQNKLKILCKLNEGTRVEKLSAQLHIISCDQKIYSQNLELYNEQDWTSYEVNPENWPVGDYSVELYPILSKTVWEEGPSVTYRRRKINQEDVPISPLSPWKLIRDTNRQDLSITDFRQAIQTWGDTKVDDSDWQFHTTTDGVSLISANTEKVNPLALILRLQGHYAVFARVLNMGCLIQTTDSEYVRAVKKPEIVIETFISACYFDTTSTTKIFPFDNLGETSSGLACLRFVPVTEESVKAFYNSTSRPPTPLYGVNDWCCYFDDTEATRLAQDQFDTLVAGQKELGMQTLDWSIGRSWVEYHSDLETTSQFPCVPYAEALDKYPGATTYYPRTTMINQFRPLDSVCNNRDQFDVEIWAWLAMQRHYGENSYGGMLTSDFFKAHPEWRRWRKNAQQADGSEVCYFFPEVRQERLDILLEVARKGIDGLLIGCCRQVPMLLYHPEMIKTYQQKTGTNPLEIDASTGETYNDWITWRANFFTQLLRDLSSELVTIEKELGKKIPVAVRIPAAGFFYNLAQGLDVKQWVSENLVDMLHLVPLEDRGGRGSQDIRPYQELCKNHDIPIIGGIGSRWEFNCESYLPSLRRAQGLLEFGVDGIEIYESEIQALCTTQRWLLPLFGNLKCLKDFIKNSNLDACYPVRASTAAFGHDNHSAWDTSTWRNWNVYGNGSNSL